MKTLILISLFLNINSSFAGFFNRPNDLSGGHTISNYNKRDKVVINTILASYGETTTLKDLERIAPKLIKRFQIATQSMIELSIKQTVVLNFKDHNFNKSKYKNFPSDESRKKRIWFYYNSTPEKVARESLDLLYKKIGKKKTKGIDLLLLVSGAQFEGLGIQVGRVAMAEHPREIAWEAEGRGRVYHLTDAEIIDELIHEIGHFIGLGHASNICHGKDALQNCCELSPSRDDVMSYCRDRSRVNEEFQFVFEACHLEKIEYFSVPQLKLGNKFKYSEQSCE